MDGRVEPGNGADAAVGDAGASARGADPTGHGRTHGAGSADQNARRQLDQELGALLATAAQGDQQSFSELYDRTSSRVYGIALRVLRSPDHAAEVAQEVYVDVWRQAARYDAGRGSVLGWISTMAHRRAVDRVRSVTSETSRDTHYAEENIEIDHDQVWARVDQNLDVEQLRRGLEKLTTIQREALTLAYFGGYSQSQVAERLGVPLGTVKTRIRDGLIGLRAALGVDA